jgi:hypothetical protein
MKKLLFKLLSAALPTLLLLIYIAVFLFIVCLVIATVVWLFHFVTKR